MNSLDRGLKVRSALVRRLVQAQNDRSKQRVRALLCDLTDQQLSSGLGCTSEDIAVLRGAQTPSATDRQKPPRSRPFGVMVNLFQPG